MALGHGQPRKSSRTWQLQLLVLHGTIACVGTDGGAAGGGGDVVAVGDMAAVLEEGAMPHRRHLGLADSTRALPFFVVSSLAFGNGFDDGDDHGLFSCISRARPTTLAQFCDAAWLRAIPGGPRVISGEFASGLDRMQHVPTTRRRVQGRPTRPGSQLESQGAPWLVTATLFLT